MITSDWLKQATTKLNEAGVGTARLDALVLLEDATGHDRAYLLAHPEKELASELVSELASKLQKRVEHEPLAYIRGKTEFYGREFIVDNSVLEPRPESETMIELLKTVTGLPSHIVDVGTGSGALAITAKLEVPTANVSAIDVDPGCLTVARQNAKKHQTEIKFHQGNLLEPLKDSKDKLALLCNLPYVPDSFTINQAAMREPKIAIFGGPDGLDYYRQLFKQIDSFKLNVKYVLAESMPPQHYKLAQIANNEHSYKLQKTDDFIQVFTKH